MAWNLDAKSLIFDKELNGYLMKMSGNIDVVYDHPILDVIDNIEKSGFLSRDHMWSIFKRMKDEIINLREGIKLIDLEHYEVQYHLGLDCIKRLQNLVKDESVPHIKKDKTSHEEV